YFSFEASAAHRSGAAAIGREKHARTGTAIARALHLDYGGEHVICPGAFKFAPEGQDMFEVRHGVFYLLSALLNNLRLQKVFDAHRQISDADTGGVVHRGSDCGSHAGEADLGDAACTIAAHDRVGIVEERNIDIRCIGAGGHQVVGQAAVDGLAAAMVVDSFFEQAHAHAHDHRADDLIGGGLGIDDSPAINHRDDATDAKARDFRIPLHFDKLRAEGVERVALRFWIFPCGDGFAVTAYAGEFSRDEYVCEV